MTTMPDLWPDDLLPSGTDPSTPIIVLRTQASNLAKRTHGLVVARVESRQSKKQGSGNISFQHTLELEAPLLGFRTPLLAISHEVSGYPVEFYEYGPQGIPRQTFFATNEEQLLDVLRGAFASSFCRQVVHSYITQSTASETGEDAA